jgi:alkyl hydroperoxide reductase subunit AhpF
MPEFALNLVPGKINISLSANLWYKKISSAPSFRSRTNKRRLYMPGNEIYDLVIIGGGPGGLTAGIYAMRAALKTALIELGAPGGQMNNSDSVENWPGDEYIGGADLAMKFSN